MVIGADLALNHGALVGIDGTVLAQYSNGIGMLSGPADLYSIACLFSRNTPANSIVIVDWDRDSGNWRSPTVGCLMTMLASFYGALAMSVRRSTVHYIAPRQVRECLGLEQKAAKSLVHEAAAVLYQIPDFEQDKHGDVLDAWLLAQTWECSKLQFSL